MKLHWDIPLKKKTRIYISIIAVTVSITIGLNYVKHRASLAQMRKNSGYLREETLARFRLNQLSKIYIQEKGSSNFVIFQNDYADDRRKIDLFCLKNLNYYSAVFVYFRDQIEGDLRYLNSNSSIENAFIYGIHQSSEILDISNKSLEFLEIRNSTVKNLHFSQGLNLRYLNLGGAKIKGIYGIENLRKLKYLNLSDQGALNLSSFPGCQELEELNIMGCEAKDFWPLTKLPKLKKLTVTLFDDIEFLKQMKGLRELNIKFATPTLSVDRALTEYSKVLQNIKKIDSIKATLPNCKVKYTVRQW